MDETVTTRSITLTAEQWASIKTQLAASTSTSAVLVVPGDALIRHNRLTQSQESCSGVLDLEPPRAELLVTPPLSGHDAIGHPGTVLVATASVEVLPVIGGHGGLDDPMPRVNVYTDAGTRNGCYILRPFTWPTEQLAIDPLPVPGRDWVVVLTDITRG